MTEWFRILVFVTGCVTTVMGQNSVQGTVLDPSGSSIPDATVWLKQGGREVMGPLPTDITGAFRFDPVAPGAYSVAVVHPGFRDVAVTVRVPGRAAAALRIVLPLAQFESSVDAEGGENARVSLDSAENRDAPSVDISLLDKVPIFDQNVLATMGAFLDAGAQGAGGTQLVVDGMQVNALGVTPSAIQEVRINQNPYSAEFARPGRGRMEIITKSTTTEYHGAANFIFRDAHFNARDPFALERPPEQRRILEGVLSGPVAHSKSTAFLFSGERQAEDLQAIVFARGLNGDIRDSVAAPKRNTQISFRVSHQFSKNHNVSWQYNDREFPSTNPGVGGVVLAEAGTTIRPAEREIIFNDQLALPPHWVNQFQILAGREREEIASATNAPKIVVQDAFTAGGAQARQLRTENHIQLNDIVNWSSGKHLVKFGVNVPDWSRRGFDDRNNFGGTFYFASLADYAALRPYAFRQQQGSGHVVFWQKELGGFVQDEWKPRANFSVTMGLRFNWQNYLGDNNNLGPRLALAWAPRKNRKTVFRGGAGMFYDRTNSGPIAELLRYNGAVLRNVLLTDPGFPDPFTPGVPIAAEPSDVVRFAPGIRAPYSTQFSIGIEQQVAKRMTLAATYRGAVGSKLFMSRDVNAPLPPGYTVRPDPSKGVVRQIESSGRQRDNALDVTLRGDLGRPFYGAGAVHGG